jgi:ankyrin repeat protein
MLHDLGKQGRLTREVVLKRFRAQSPLFHTVKNHNVELAHLMIEKGDLTPEQILQQDGYDSRSILHQAIINKDIRMVKMLLEATQSSPESIEKSVDLQNSTPLHFAVMSGDFESVRLLFEKGKISPRSILQKNKSGETPIFMALRNRDLKIVKFLIQRGGLSPEQVGQKANNRVSFLQAMLIRLNAEKSGVRPSAGAVTISELLSALADDGVLHSNQLSFQDKYGDTPLHTAALLGHVRELQPLFIKGILSSEQLSIENKDGKTPFQMADARGKSILLKYMEPKQVQRELDHVENDEETKKILLEALKDRAH